MPPRVPKTTKEALNMVKRGWMFLLKKNPAVFAPLSFWMLFGGFIFLYNYVDADKFTVKEAQPLSQSSFNIMPQAVASEMGGGVPIVFNNQLWGYEDTTFIAKVAIDRPILLVYDKISKKVYEIEFSPGRDIKQQMKMQRKY